ILPSLFVRVRGERRELVDHGLGLSPDDARRRTRGSRAAWPAVIMFHDLRIGIRLLRRSPGFSLVAVLCLTLGIAATTSVSSWIEGILVGPFAMVARQERMFAMTGTDRNGRTDISWPDFQDLQKNCNLVEGFVAEHIGGATLSIGDRAEMATGSVV